MLKINIFISFSILHCIFVEYCSQVVEKYDFVTHYFVQYGIGSVKIRSGLASLSMDYLW